MSISAARLAAFEILLRVEEQGAYASKLLHSERLASLSATDRGLCTELVMGALRWQSALDDDIQAISSQKLNRIDAAVLIALRLGAYQLRFLGRIPMHAAINESVELVKRARKKSAAPFANAVLRKLSGKHKRPDGKTITGGFVIVAGAESPAALAAASAHPPWLVARWVVEFGSERAQRICQFDQQAPPLALRMPASRTVPPQQVTSGLVGNPVDTIEAQLWAEGVELAPGRLLRSARVVLSGTGSLTHSVVARAGAESDVAHAPAYLEPRLAIQDEGSQLVAALVGKGAHILDCCAAPGNKTAALAEANPGAAIVAVELHPHRAKLLRNRMVAFAGVEVITADVTALPHGRQFDRILADVPCSGTGTLARNPEIKWKLRPDDLTDLHARQKAILAAALRHLVAGGVIVYSTCSLETEENAAVVEEVLREHPEARLLDCRARLHELEAEGELTWPDVESLTSGLYLRTLPGTHPCDGFFAAMITA